MQLSTSIKALLKEALAFALRYTGIPLLVRKLFVRTRVTIAVYHDPRPATVRRHLQYLSSYYKFLSLTQLVRAIHSRDWSNIPRNAIVITLDDGHRGNFDLLHLFQKYSVTPTVFVCSQIADTNRHFWFRVLGADVPALKKLPNEQKLAVLRQRYDFQPTTSYPYHQRQALESREIMLMKDGVEFQSHGRFHPILTACSDQECWEEISESKAEIAQLVGEECEHFAFPNGDYTAREIEATMEAGYLSARTIDIGWNGPDTDPYRLKVVGITDDASINYLVCQLSGIPAYVQYLLRGSLNGKSRTTTLQQSE
jgi:peptidoglycan/xylan/chitin deacetylase (PgdA/CDA1 family)